MCINNTIIKDLYQNAKSQRKHMIKETVHTKAIKNYKGKYM